MHRLGPNWVYPDIDPVGSMISHLTDSVCDTRHRVRFEMFSGRSLGNKAENILSLLQTAGCAQHH